MDIDVLGSYNTLKATLPHLVTSAGKHKTDGRTPPPSGTGGRIIFISAAFHYTGMPLQTHVTVAKAGVDALSNNVALELGPRGVTSNVISPGPIAGTEGMERLSRPEELADSLKRVPLGRWGTVKEISDATVYLFSDAGNFVNGQTLIGKHPPSDLCSSEAESVPSSRWRGVADGRVEYGRFQISGLSSRRRNSDRSQGW